MMSKTVTETVRRLWYGQRHTTREKMLLLPLALLSLPYRFVVSLRRLLFDRGFFKQHKTGVAVISVGNLTVGGTGKTPMVIMLAQRLQAKGFRPAVLSRGYGSKATSPVNIVSDGERILMGGDEAGDEPVLIAGSAKGVPVLTGAKRILTAAAAVERLGADVLILDDGFQHRQIARNIDIVLLDSANPFGNGLLFPAGPLREPLSALKRADIIIATGTYDDVATPRPMMLPDGVQAPVFKSYYQPRNLLHGARETAFPPELVKGKKICAFAGIGNPLAFEKTLAALGADVAVFIPFPDHHRYTEQDVGLIDEKARQCRAEMIVTTEKDKVKLERFDVFLSGIYALRIEMEFLSAREDFERLLLEKLNEDHTG
jgi:tetraacyldisaccharide 4'-kinase